MKNGDGAEGRGGKKPPSQIQKQQHLQQRSADACTAVDVDMLRWPERNTVFHLHTCLKSSFKGTCQTPQP